ncbi:hypothetical protein [Actinoplanes italicus]|uniref:hypothetical protein n=1 Tax=Actinoplanes italicus TaxID=113567 RepID=UPI001940CF31|nr:hypothetical protein [Actinoplanes italicus]
MSDTPLSDLMAEHSDTSSPDSYARFLEMFRDSIVGVVGIGTVTHDAQGLPVTAPGFAVGRTTHGDGRHRILTFADPDVAAQRPNSQCNAGVPGRVLLQMAVEDPECEGILVNSATRQISLVIGKESAQFTTDGVAVAPKKKPWWRPR